MHVCGVVGVIQIRVSFVCFSEGKTKPKKSFLAICFSDMRFKNYNNYVYITNRLSDS